MSNLSGRIAVYTTPEKKAEVEAAIAESGRTKQEWLRDALERALAPDAATGDDREMELRLQGAVAEIRRLEAHLADTTSGRERLEVLLAQEQANMSTFVHALPSGRRAWWQVWSRA